MVKSIANNEGVPGFFWNIGKLLAVLSGIVLLVVSLTIFQDFLESKRSNYAFYFNESLLFKLIWFLFIPILTMLYKTLEKKKPDNMFITTVFIIVPIGIHLAILPFIGVFLTALFYDGYDLYKFFSYTLAQDFYKLVIVYAGFVLVYRYFSNQRQYVAGKEGRPPVLDAVIINNGKDNAIVNVKDIVLITSATPYIFIHTENKKYIHSETLKSISAQLEQDVFVQVHKSAVVNISNVIAFTSRLNGDYDLQLKNGGSVRLSRTYAAKFKTLFGIAPQVRR